MRVVSPFRPFPIESAPHRKLGAFNWIAAMTRLAESVRASCGCDTWALTDYATEVPLLAHRFDCSSARLMEWILEVSLAYLESDAFDEDTVFASPDLLIMGDLRPYFAGDLTVLVRLQPKYHNRPILNGVQWWPVEAKARLVSFYRSVLTTARELPEPYATWGADSEALRQHLLPLVAGLHDRSGLRVSLRPFESVCASITASMIAQLRASGTVRPADVPIVDFKGPTRKPYMAAYWNAVRPR